MKVTTVQPDYLPGENPDFQVRKFISEKLDEVEKGELILFPEYSNAGGLSAPADEMKAMETAPGLLLAAAETAKQKGAVVAINVLERRNGVIKNTTHLFGKDGETVFLYDKIHLPPSEVKLGMEPSVKPLSESCTVDYEGIRYGFMTCYDVYYNEQIEYLASQKPDIILLPGYQRGERRDILEAQTKMIAFRCNSFVVKSSYSMHSIEKGGCSMIVSPEGKILGNLGAEIGKLSLVIDPKEKYYRAAGYGEKPVRNDDFINYGLTPAFFEEKGTR